jgi:hypothetical protein
MFTVGCVCVCVCNAIPSKKQKKLFVLVVRPIPESVFRLEGGRGVHVGIVCVNFFVLSTHIFYAVGYISTHPGAGGSSLRSSGRKGTSRTGQNVCAQIFCCEEDTTGHRGSSVDAPHSRPPSRKYIKSRVTWGVMFASQVVLVHPSRLEGVLNA